MRARFPWLMLPLILNAGCAHVPAEIKAASARQDQALSALARTIEQKGLQDKCRAVSDAAESIESQMRVIRAKSDEWAAKNTAPGIVERLTRAERIYAQAQEQLSEQRRSCRLAYEALAAAVNEAARSSSRLDKLIQGGRGPALDAGLARLEDAREKIDLATEIIRPVAELAKMIQELSSAFTKK